MKFPIILCFLLAYAVSAQSAHFHDEGFLEDDLAFDADADAKIETEFPGSCFICKRILEKVQRTLSKDDTKAALEKKLHGACTKLRLGRICQRLVSKYINKLRSELSTTDSPRTACVKIRLCRPKALWE
ncbi:antimicrobial peptide NK-lysin-like isoform X1 [Conger conger]|uniref:antimicrobial peptide NK-lysin-like isoform X1 n=1 Tax=Conger conger TaxID=82655 RepID=UPI002A5ADAF7|nr:antimicrobial peptide NK-lysin-like isoform X1 [Conger conger]